MQSTHLVVGAYVLFVVACGVIGVRLVALAGRTRQLPEFLLGFGLSCMVAAMPLLGISGFGRGSAGDFNAPLGMVALGLLWLGISCQASFTWRTFRPRSLPAAGLVALIAGIEAVACTAAFRAITGADAQVAAFDATSRWVLLIRIPVGAMYFWTGLEGFLSFRMVQRREALGLADPVVTNRLFLWCFVGWTAATNNGIAGVLHLYGRGPTSDPLAALVMAVGGCIGAVCLSLAFLPPDRYLDFVRRRGVARS